MIVVKTGMSRMPGCCSQCRKYMNKHRFGEPCCGADGELRNLTGVYVSRQRAKWCPLVEAKKKKRED